MAQPKPDSWPGNAARLLMRAPGESWSALAAVSQHLCNFSGAAAGTAVREAVAAERWSEVYSTVASHVNSAAIKSGRHMTSSAASLSKAVARSFRSEAEGTSSREPGLPEELISSRFAWMIGRLAHGKTAVPGISGNGTAGRKQQARTPVGSVETNPPSLPAAQRKAGSQAGAASRSPFPHFPSAATSAGTDWLGGVLRRLRGEEEVEEVEEEEHKQKFDDVAEADLAPLENVLQGQQDFRPREPLETAGCGLPEFLPYSSKVPWHQGPRAFFSMFFPRYGNYCGPNWSSGRSSGPLSWDKPPIDHLDYCCYRHDIGYDSYDQRDLLRSDLELVRCLKTIPDRDQSAVITVAQVYRMLCIVGLQRFLIPYRRELVRRAAFTECERATQKSER